MVPSGSGRPREAKDLEGHRGDAQSCSWESGHALPLVPPFQERRGPQSHEAVCKGRMQGGAPGGPWARGGHPASRRPRRLQPTPRRGTGPAAAQPPRCGEPCVAGTSLSFFEGRPESPRLLHRNFLPGGRPGPSQTPPTPASLGGAALPPGPGQAPAPPSREASGSRLPAFSSSSGSAAAKTERRELSLPNTHQSRHSPSPGREVGPQSFCAITFVERKDKMFINGS